MVQHGSDVAIASAFFPSFSPFSSQSKDLPHEIWIHADSESANRMPSFYNSSGDRGGLNAISIEEKHLNRGVR